MKNKKVKTKFKYNVGDRVLLIDGSIGKITTKFDLSETALVKTGPAYFIETKTERHALKRTTPEYMIKKLVKKSRKAAK